MVIILPLDSPIMDITLLRERKYIVNTQEIDNLCLIEKIPGGQVRERGRKGQKQSSFSSFIQNQIAALIFPMQLSSCGVACAYVCVPTCVHVSPPAPCSGKLEAGEFVIRRHALQHFIFARERKIGQSGVIYI